MLQGQFLRESPDTKIRQLLKAADEEIQDKETGLLWPELVEDDLDLTGDIDTLPL
ncbi:MAG: hypothetical protein HYT30_02555 [Parcubacteria group bacterium]|nr:hypothetical protein [Parcubacteria group bacterium]